MKRTPLRRTPMRRGKGKGKYARRPRDVPYMLAVKGLPCLVAGRPGAGPCSPVVEADHAGKRALGQKADDRTCIPLCSLHHRHRHERLGWFARFRDPGSLRRWLDSAIAITQALVAHG